MTNSDIHSLPWFINPHAIQRTVKLSISMGHFPWLCCIWFYMMFDVCWCLLMSVDALRNKILDLKRWNATQLRRTDRFIVVCHGLSSVIQNHPKLSNPSTTKMQHKENKKMYAIWAISRNFGQSRDRFQTARLQASSSFSNLPPEQLWGVVSSCSARQLPHGTVPLVFRNPAVWLGSCLGFVWVPQALLEALPLNDDEALVLWWTASSAHAAHLWPCQVLQPLIEVEVARSHTSLLYFCCSSKQSPTASASLSGWLETPFVNVEAPLFSHPIPAEVHTLHPQVHHCSIFCFPVLCCV